MQTADVRVMFKETVQSISQNWKGFVVFLAPFFFLVILFSEPNLLNAFLWIGVAFLSILGGLLSLNQINNDAIYQTSITNEVKGRFSSAKSPKRCLSFFFLGIVVSFVMLAVFFVKKSPF